NTGVEKPPLVFFQHQTGEAICCIGARIDPDPVGANFRGQRRCVAVDDKLAVLSLSRQKLVSDIQKVLARLMLKGHAWPDASVAEEIIADCCRGLKGLKKTMMMFGKSRLESGLNRFGIPSRLPRADIDPIRVQRLEAPNSGPSLQNLLV